MKGKRIIAALAVAAGASALVGVGSAVAAAPVALTSSSPLSTLNAEAYNVSSTGGLYSAPANQADCVGFPSATKTAPLLSIPGLATASTLSDRCAVSATDQTAYGISNIARISLLGGKVVITGLRTQCISDSVGNTTVQSSIATLNGVKVATGPVKIELPGLISVYLDKNSETAVADSDGLVRMQSIGVEVVVPPMTSTVLGRTRTTPGLDVIVGECHIDGFPYSNGGGGLG